MGVGHYTSHLLAQVTQDIETAKVEVRRLESVVFKVEGFVANANLAREEAIHARDEAISRANSI